MITASTSHIVLIPSYNPGPKVYDTVRAARLHWNPVWVVIDGSTDGSEVVLQTMATEDSGLRVIHLPRNKGKGAAVLHGLNLAAADRLHTCADHGFRRAASAGADSRFYDRINPAARRHGARHADI